MLPAVLLAAGRSSRFGGAKALADAGGRSFISRILHTLQEGGAGPLVVVARSGDHRLLEAVAGAGVPARVAENPRADQGQLTSLLAGLDAVEDGIIDGVLVALVDMPLIAPDSVRRVLTAAERSSAAVLRAVYRGRHGHPVVFRRPAFAALRAADPAVGAKAVVRALATEDVDVADPGVLEDVDTPDDYTRLFGAE
jgi:CTP:molybdopterin cytidylyltransferase MocA